MKTKQIPAIVMLAGGLVYCIIGFQQQFEAGTFLKQLLLILIVFFIIGEIAKAVLDPFFKEENEQTEEKTEDAETDLQEIAQDEQDGQQSKKNTDNYEAEKQTEESQKTAGDV
ncbi:MAG: hypothetical protein ACI4HI_04295 [Lachnospiraceae bacterium]